MSETKRRLLISKWRVPFEQQRGPMHSAEYGRRLELLDNWHSDQLFGADSEKYGDMAYERDQLRDQLTDVKYWLHDGIVHGKIVSDPRVILRKVEEVLQ